MSLESEELKQRARTFSVAILRLVDRLPHTIGAQVVGRQLAKSATSAGSNYVAACSARSRAEFIAKLCIVNEESDESVNWLEIIILVPYLPRSEVEPHKREAIELRAIFGRSLGTARRNAGGADQ
jgi:four helix bundle protein